MGIPSWVSSKRNLASLKKFAIKHPWYAAAGVVTGSVLLSSLHHGLSLQECKRDADLSGKTVIITGGEEGIGKATAMEFARRNAEVIIGSKNEALASQVVKEIKATTGNRDVYYKPLDLGCFSSIKNFADYVNRTEPEVNLLINAADVFWSGDKKITDDGCEYMMQSNYFGHFLLTLSLAELMKESAPSKIINVTSVGHQFAPLDLNDLSSSYNYSPLRAYLSSKLACLLFTAELSSKLEGKGITVNAVNPGLVKSSGTNKSFRGFFMKIIYFLYGKTPAQGAQTILEVAVSERTELVSGRYFRNCRERKLPKALKNENLVTKLFKLSEDIVDRKM